MSFNLATILHEKAMATPGAPAEIADGRVTTYRDLDERSGRFAAGPRESGLMPGQVVALQLPNVPLFLTAYFGALKAGTAVLPLNPLLQAPEIEYHLTDSSARLLIAFDADLGEARRACQAAGVPSTRPAGPGRRTGYAPSRLQVPREVRFMTELPKGPSGKILKTALRGG